jgi:hypothetical protein
MALPLSMVIHLRIKMSQKIAVMGVFTLALFIIAIDIARFALVLVAPTSLDNLLIWNIVECTVVIIVINAPVLRPLLFKRNFMRGSSLRRPSNTGFLSTSTGGSGGSGHRRAQSTPWSTSASGEGADNRMPMKSSEEKTIDVKDGTVV